MIRRLVLTTMAVLIVGACSPEGAVSDTTVPSSTTTTADAATTTTGSAETTTTTVAVTTTSEPAGPGGEPVDLGPPNGAVLAVVGVEHDDVLNIRSNPGAGQPIVGTIAPTADDVVAMGETRALPSFWTKVEHDGTTGWVNMRFLAYVGQTIDVTSDLHEQLGPSIEAATMEELGRLVADVSASEEPPSEIVEVVDETIDGDLGEVTFDVIGLGDDSVLGVRLHVFGEPLDDLWRVRTVEQTILCHPTRGVSDDGICA